jgi:hypothetical protein
MIDADAVVLGPGTGLVVPECVGFGFVIDGTQGVGKAEILELPEGIAGFGTKQCVALPDLGVVAIDRLGNDIVVAGKNQWLLQRQAVFGERLQPLHPGQLVGEFLGVDGVAVGKIQRNHTEHAAIGREHRLDEPGLLVAVIPGETAIDFIGAFPGQDRDAVEALLSMGFNVIAKRLEFQPGKALIDRLDFLQTRDVRIGYWKK